MKHIAKMVHGLAHSRATWQVFSDFVELSAISLSNAVDVQQREAREERYMRIVKQYRPEDVAVFPRMLAEVMLALEKEPTDVLGALYGELELANKWAGQFFTPQNVADMMGQMVIGEHLRQDVEERGFITMEEPAVGGGAMVIGACKAFQALGLNYQTQLHVTATDVDEKAVHMAYIQLSLLGVPAVVIHGNTLTQERYGAWYTPLHVYGLWSQKLARVRRQEDKPTEPTSEPTQAGQLSLALA